MEYESNYLCSCKYLLYVDLKSKKEFCLNEECENRLDEAAKVDFTQIISHVKEKNVSFALQIRKYSKDALSRYLVNRRESAIVGLLTMQGMRMDEFYGVNELLKRINSNPLN